MINFSKSFFINKSMTKESLIDSPELNFTSGNNPADSKSSYAEQLSISGLSFNQMERIYIIDLWIRATIDRIVDKVDDVAPIIKPSKSFIDYDKNVDAKLSEGTRRHIGLIQNLISKPNSNYESFSSIRKKLTRDLLKFDAAGLELVDTLRVSTNKQSNGLEIYTVPGNTIKINVDNNGILKNDAYKQIDTSTGRISASWDKEHFLYFMNNPQSNRIYGLSPLESLTQTVTADLYAANHNLSFFQNNATPRLAVLVEGMGLGQGTTGLQRIRKWWDDELAGKPYRPIIMGTESGKVDVKAISMSNEDMQFQEYSRWLVLKIFIIYKMQPVIMGMTDSKTSTSSSDIQEQIRLFKQDAIKPNLDLIAERFNRIIFNKFGFKDVYLDFDLDITDRKAQAEIDKTYGGMGVLTINDIRVHGLGMTPVPWGNIPYMQNNVAPFGNGPNGSAVPKNNNDTNLNTKNPNVPNIATNSKSYIEKYISKSNGKPVGWEDLELNEKVDAILKALDSKGLMGNNTIYSFPSYTSKKIGEIVDTKQVYR